jgi:nitrogen fixation/metabolism regulation signal transduction histidine kinase
VRFGLGLRAALSTALMLAAGALCWVLTDGRVVDADLRALLAGVAAALTALVTHAFVVRPSAVAGAVGDGLLAYSEQDYSIRLTATVDDPWDLARRFNVLGETLRRSHNDIYQKEMMLETVLGATPIAILLDNEAGRVVYANGTARELLGDGKPLEGRSFDELVAELAPEVRDALARPVDALFSVEGAEHHEVYDVARRFFDINTQRHRLTMIRPLGRELERRDAEAWKQVIRVIGHELNNSLAPIASLVRSARSLVEGPRADKLRGVLETVEERTRHLNTFLDGFARLARLPRPNPEEVPWAPFLASVQAVHSFTLVGEPPTTPGWFDRAQLQQVIINLVKNAHEAGSPGDKVELRVTAHDGGVRIQVLDRGQGMTDEVRRRALLPFYSTKKSGGGIGLALSREIVDAHGGRLGLAARDGGGTIVELWLPGATVHASPSESRVMRA